MKNKFRFFIFISFLFSAVNLYSQSVNAPYEVGTWYGFKQAAITFTFDDNCPNQLAIAVPMLNDYKFPGTFFIVPNWKPDWSGFQEAANKGHEIASHTVTHLSFKGATDEQQTAELKNCQIEINDKIKNQKCITFAYPYCDVGNYSIVQQYYIASRGCQGFIEGPTPADFNNISSIICGALGDIKTAADFKLKAENAVSNNGWCVLLFHGIDGDGGYSPIPSTELKSILEYLDTSRNKYWVATFADIARYIKERNAVEIKELSATESSITLSVTDNLDDSIYSVPVTIRRLLPQGWTTCSVSQNGKNVESQIVDSASSKYIMFNAVPDNGGILLSKDAGTN